MLNLRSTLDYYNKEARSFFLRTIGIDMTPDYALFLEHMPKGGKVLDAGCGSGRDARYFLEKGYDVFACDASEEMVKLSSEYIGQPAHLLSLEEINFQEEFDGIWCSATLLHIPPSKQQKVLGNLINALKPNGLMYFSYKLGTTEEHVEGRYFLNMDEQSVNSLLSPFKSISVKEMRTRPSFSSAKTLWLTTLIQKNS